MEGDPLVVVQCKHTSHSLVYCGVCTLIQLDLSPKRKTWEMWCWSEECVPISEVTQFHLLMQNSTPLQTILVTNMAFGTGKLNVCCLLKCPHFGLSRFEGFHTYSVNGFDGSIMVWRVCRI